MTQLKELLTPSFLVDLNVLEYNIKEMAQLAQENDQELWPMLKTHKSMAIAKMQQVAGAKGFLTGTIDEAEKLAEMGYTEIMLAYPVAAKENLQRVIELASKTHLILSLDGLEAAAQMDEALQGTKQCLDYLIIVDSGLHRFGVPPENILNLANNLGKFKQLVFRGIATHPGHVYGASGDAQVKSIAQEEVGVMATAKELLEGAGYQVEIVATGSTPTVELVAKSPVLTALRPGNYVFYDALQVALGVVPETRCALTVLATIIANPQPDLFIMDAGSKCFGLDKGAHGISLTSGYGIVKGHPELVVEGLSEEVGKIRAQGQTTLKVGDKIQVIPNHACSSANMTNYLIGYRDGQVAEIMYIDVRGGSYRQPPRI